MPDILGAMIANNSSSDKHNHPEPIGYLLCHGDYFDCPITETIDVQIITHVDNIDEYTLIINRNKRLDGNCPLRYRGLALVVRDTIVSACRDSPLGPRNAIGTGGAVGAHSYKNSIRINNPEVGTRRDGLRCPCDAIGASGAAAGAHSDK